MEIKQVALSTANKITDINVNHNFLNLPIVLLFVVTASSWVIKNVIIKIKLDVQITVRQIQAIVVLIKQEIYQIVQKYVEIMLLLLVKNVITVMEQAVLKIVNKMMGILVRRLSVSHLLANQSVATILDRKMKFVIMVTIQGAQKIVQKIKDINVKEKLDNHQFVIPNAEMESM